MEYALGYKDRPREYLNSKLRVDNKTNSPFKKFERELDFRWDEMRHVRDLLQYVGNQKKKKKKSKSKEQQKAETSTNLINSDNPSSIDSSVIVESIATSDEEENK